MKNSKLLYTLILACTLQFATAQNYVLTSVAKQGATYMNVAEKSITFSLTEGERTIAVNTNIDFQFESDAEWCKVTKDGANIIIAVEPNNDTKERTTIVTIKAKDGHAQIIEITQACKAPDAKGIWQFEDSENLLSNSVATTFAMQPGRMNGKQVTMTDIASAGITQIEGPTANNKAILLPADILLNMQFTSDSDEKINNYTIMYDVREEKNNNFNALLQPNLNNTTDAQFFINEKAQVGVYAGGNWGYGGYIYAGRWHRIIITVKDGVPNAYIDGKLVTPGKNAYGGAWCLDPKGCHLFADESGERMNFDVAEIRYWDETLSSMQVAELGEVNYKYIYSTTKKVELLENKNEFTIDVNSSVIPEFVLPEWIKPVDVTPIVGNAVYKFKADDLETAGTREGTITIKAQDGSNVTPLTINVKQEYSGGGLPTCTGKWLFDKANDLYTTAEGNARLVPYQLGTNGIFTAYNSPADASVEVISEGITLRKATCFKMELDEAETFSNYTIVFDVRISDYSWRGLLQTNLKNNEDAGFFINTKGQVGLGVGGFGYAGMIELNKWARIAIVVKDGYPSVYIDGTLVKTSTSTNNNRWFMDKSGAYLFCDNDGETADTDIAGIYFWNKALTAEQMATMGASE